MNVHLAVPDLLWPDRDSRAAADPGRCTALETLLARGRRSSTVAGGLEQWLLAAWRTAGPAAHALIADGGIPDDAWWLRADPCSLRLNRETAVPLDAAMFEITRDEADTLAGHLNRQLEGRGLVVHALQPERWYLRSDAPLGAAATPLAAARGKPIDVHPGAGGDEARLHALANELQMLLHDHPVNEARERRGAPPINAVWLWGGGRHERTTLRPFQRVRTQDPLAAGLALGSGAAVLPLPEDAGRWLRASGNDGLELIVLDALRAPAAYGDAATWRERLGVLERGWFAPLAGALRQGRIGMVTLHAIGAAGAFDVETTRQDLRYFWRRPRPLASYV
jgi:hypothetical protein